MLFMCLKSGPEILAAASSATDVGEHGDHPKLGTHTNDLRIDDELFRKRSGPLRPSRNFVTFVITPPARRDRLAEEVVFTTVEDVEEIAKATVGIPLLKNHKAGEVLGRIVDSHVDEQKRIVAKVHMEDTKAGREALENVRNGKAAGVSLGQRFVTDDMESTLSALTQKIPIEISLTPKPEFEEHTWAVSVTTESADVSSSPCAVELQKPNAPAAEFGMLAAASSASSTSMSTEQQLSMTQSVDGKTVEIQEGHSAAKLSQAQQRALHLQRIREEERERAKARHEAEREHQEQLQREKQQAEAAAAAEAAAREKAEAEEKAKTASERQLEQIAAQLKQIQDAQYAQQNAADWSPASQKAHLVPAEANVAQRVQHAKTQNIVSPQQTATTTETAKPMSEAKETATLDADQQMFTREQALEMFESMMKQREEKAKQKEAEEEALAKSKKRKAAEPSLDEDIDDDFLDEEDDDLELEDEQSALDSVKEKIDSLSKKYLAEKKKYLTDLAKFKETSAEMDEDARVKRKVLLQKRKEKLAESTKEFKEWVSSRMAEYAKDANDAVKEEYSHTVGNLNSKRGLLKDSDFGAVRSQMVVAAASSKSARGHARSLTALQKRIDEERREKATAQFRAQKLGMKVDATNGINSSDPRKRAKTRAPSSTVLTSGLSQEEWELFGNYVHSSDGFRSKNAQLVAAASSLQYETSNAEGEKNSDGTLAAASSAEINTHSTEIRNLLQQRQSFSPKDVAWAQRNPDMEDLAICTEQGDPMFAQTRTRQNRGSHLHPPRRLDGLNNPRSARQAHLFQKLMQARHGSTIKNVNAQLFTADDSAVIRLREQQSKK